MFETALNQWQEKTLADSEMALAFFLHFHQQKYPSSKLVRALDEQGADKILLDKFVFKKVRPKALLALKKWLNGEWNLKLVTKILDPFEVLAFQAQGIRPVTMKIQKELKPILHKEDCLEFFLHDLEHAHMFFFDSELKEMQIEFFQRIQESLKSEIWNKYQSNPVFKERFYYLISDMNTHKEHYRHYLNAMLHPEDIAKFEYIFR